MRRWTVPVGLTILVSVVLVIVFYFVDLTPLLASAQGKPVDKLIRMIFNLTLVIFALCMVFLFYNIVAFRRQPSDEEDATPVWGSTTMEIAWTIVPLIIVMWLAFYSAGILFDIRESPAQGEEIEVKVTGRQWSWTFEYPQWGITSADLILPVDRPVLFRLYATDVIHSFYIPEFRLKMDTIPGVENHIRIKPTQRGEFKVRCAELCGTGHAYMLAPVKVVSEEEFQKWVQAQTLPLTLVEEGKKTAQQFGCLGCHSIDGSRLVGPSWKGLFGRKTTLQDGTTLQADEEYIRRSILEPDAQVVQGFPNVMPKTFKDQLSPEQLQAIIAYIKSLSE
ncbi:MAG: cytochrome c oxidase subunit II [Nitrospinota bacterium]|nr:MAG: cytochrome c oxidase subunit II [Nitrospinota bacterium]